MFEVSVISGYFQALILPTYKFDLYHFEYIVASAYICRTCSSALHLSLGSSMVRASHRSSEGCGFDPRLGLKNRFSEDRAWRSFICHLNFQTLKRQEYGVIKGHAKQETCISSQETCKSCLSISENKCEISTLLAPPLNLLFLGLARISKDKWNTITVVE